jgi:hypothetical protein
VRKKALNRGAERIRTAGLYSARTVSVVAGGDNSAHLVPGELRLALSRVGAVARPLELSRRVC